MSSIDPVRTPTSRSRQPTNTMQPPDSNHLATAVHQFKSLVIHPASNAIKHTSNTQRIIVLAIATPILFLPAIFTVFFVPLLLLGIIVLYILAYGAEKTERDVRVVLESELGLGTELGKGIGEVAKNAYASIYTWFAALGVTALDYLINVNKIHIS